MARKRAGTADNPPPKKKGKYASKEDKALEDPVSCVNIKLNSLWNPALEDHPATLAVLKTTMAGVVRNWNKMALEASCFANVHLLRLIRESAPLPKLDQDFFEACIRVVTDGAKERKEEGIRETFAHFKSLRPNREEGADYQPPSNALSTNLIHNLRRQMEVNATNHVVCTFVKRLIRFVRSKYTLNRGDAWKMVMGVFDVKNADPSEAQQWLKDWLVHNPLSDYTLKKERNHFFRLTYDMLVHQEGLDPMTKGRRMFSLLPVAQSYIPSHAILDRTTLKEVLQQLPEEHRRVIGARLTKGGDLVKVAMQKKVFNFSREMFSNLDLSAEIWRFLFRVEPMETANRYFDYGMSTNGYDVSLRFRVKGRQAGEDRSYSPEEFDRFVGVDPGRTFIATGCATTTADPDVEETPQFSLKEYRHLSKMNESRQWEERLRERETQYQAIIQGMPSMKSTNLDEAVRYRLGVGDWMFRFCEEKAFLKWRFKTKIYSRKAMAEVARRITGGKRGGRTVVGLGDWSQQDMIKGTPKAPLKAMKAELKKRAVVIDIDEYRTSKTCSVCNGMDAMKNVRVYKDVKNRRGEESRRLVKCHQIVRCINTDCTKCWQRDRNAARNIYGLLWGILSGEERPPAMTRASPNMINTRARLPPRAGVHKRV